MRSLVIGIILLTVCACSRQAVTPELTSTPVPSPIPTLTPAPNLSGPFVEGMIRSRLCDIPEMRRLGYSTSYESVLASYQPRDHLWEVRVKVSATKDGEVSVDTLLWLVDDKNRQVVPGNQQAVQFDGLCKKP